MMEGVNSATSPSVSATAPGREWGVDLARGVAVVSMFVAHTAPGAGPFDLLMLSEFLTFPLFALLVGAGAELGARRLAVLPHAAASLVRASTLLALGWALHQAGAHVVIVLAPLGVLTLLCWGVSRLPTPAVLAVGAVAGLLGPWTIESSRSTWIELAVAGDRVGLWWFELFVSTSYPQAVLLLCGCLGILVTRLLLPRGRGVAAWGIPAGLLLGTVLVVATLSAARMSDRIELQAYETTWWEEVYVGSLAVGVFAGCLLVSRWSASRVLLPLAWVGAMTLTVYALHVGWLAWWARGLFPGTPDDTWVNVVGMTVGAVVVASAWRWWAPPAPWSRGPLEGVVGLGVKAAVGAVSQPAEEGPVDAVSPARTEVPEPLDRR